MKAQPGDKVIITNPRLKDLCGAICVVADCDTVSLMVKDMSECIWAHEDTKNHDEIFWLRHGDYEVLEDCDVPIVGDMVIVTYKFLKSVYLKTFVVHTICVDDLIVAIKCDDCKPFTLEQKFYRILKRDSTTSTKVCKDCNGTGKIVLLTSVVDCDCVNV